MSVVKGLPIELKGMDMVSLPDSVSSYSVKVAPQNLTSISSNTFTVNSTNVAAAKIQQLTFPSTQVNFDIPAGMSKNTWVDTAKSTISYRVNYKRVEGSTQLGNIMTAQLQHNAFNYWNRIFHVSATGNIIDDVPLINLAHTNYLQQNLSVQELDSLALPYGFNAETTVGGAASSNANTGHAIAGWNAQQSASTTTNNYYSYEMPLPSSVIGSYARGMFPIGSVSKMTLSLVCDSIAPVGLYFSGQGTASASTDLQIIISDIAINLQYVDLGEEGSRLLGGGAKICSGITQRVSSSTINAGTSGAVSVLMGLRGSSVRNLTTRCVENSVSLAGCANDKYDSKLLLATGLNYYLQGSQRVPPNPLDSIRSVASVYMRALQASHAFNERAYKMCSTPQSFCIYTDVPAGTNLPSDKDSYLTSSATAISSLATWMFSYPLQKVSKSKILDGMSFQQSNQFFETTLNVGSTNNLTLYFIAELDVIYIITPDGDVQTRI